MKSSLVILIWGQLCTLKSAPGLQDKGEPAEGLTAVIVK